MSKINALAFLHTFLNASVTDLDDERVLTVHRSPVVRDTDPCMRPVLDFLAERQCEEVSTRTVGDESFMFGERVITTYRVCSTAA